MSRSRSLTIAAVLQAVLGFIDIGLALRILAAGLPGLPPPAGAEAMGGPPFAAGVIFLVAGVACLFSAYGLWIGQKWGRIVTIVTRVFFTLAAAGDLLGAVYLKNYPFMSLSILYIVLSIYVIYLVLRREPVPVPA